MRFIAPLLACVLSLALPAGASAASWAWPVRGEVLTPYLNGTDPYAGGQHRGIDVAAPVGTVVTAAHGGTVTFAGVAGSSGRTVSVRTDDNAFDTSYLHLEAIEVAVGEHLSLGGSLGSVGTSGRRSAAEPHLHFGVRAAGTDHGYVDPLGLLPPPPSASPPELPPALPVPVPVPAVPPPLPSLEALTPSAVPAPAALPGLLPWASPAQMPATAPAQAPAPVRPQLAPEPTTAVERPPQVAVTPVEPEARPGGPPAQAPGVVHDAAAREAGPSAVSPPGPGLAAGAEPARTPVATEQRRRREPAASGPPSLNSDLRTGSRSPDPRPRDLSSRRVAAPPTSDGGPDIGWIAACIALLALSAALGRPGRGGEATKRRPLARPETPRAATGEPITD